MRILFCCSEAAFACYVTFLTSLSDLSPAVNAALLGCCRLCGAPSLQFLCLGVASLGDGSCQRAAARRFQVRHASDKGGYEFATAMSQQVCALFTERLFLS